MRTATRAASLPWSPGRLEDEVDDRSTEQAKDGDGQDELDEREALIIANGLLSCGVVGDGHECHPFIRA